MFRKRINQEIKIFHNEKNKLQSNKSTLNHYSKFIKNIFFLDFYDNRTNALSKCSYVAIDNPKRSEIISFGIRIDQTKYFYLDIIIDDNYPFRCPNININNHKYLNLISKKCLKSSNYYRCLCCESITCANNWSPMNQMIDIINESITNYFLLRDEINILICKKIEIKLGLIDRIRKYL